MVTYESNLYWNWYLNSQKQLLLNNYEPAINSNSKSARPFVQLSHRKTSKHPLQLKATVKMSQHFIFSGEIARPLLRRFFLQLPMVIKRNNNKDKLLPQKSSSCNTIFSTVVKLFQDCEHVEAGIIAEKIIVNHFMHFPRVFDAEHSRKSTVRRLGYVIANRNIRNVRWNSKRKTNGWKNKYS